MYDIWMEVGLDNLPNHFNSQRHVNPEWENFFVTVFRIRI